MKKDFIPSPVKVLFPLNGSSCWLLHRNTPTIPQDYFFARTHDEAHAKKQKQSRLIGSGKWWWEMDSNHRSQRQQIYSLPPLAARESHRMERVKGIEPSQSAWKADVLPLNYTRLRRMKKLFYLLTKIRLCYYTHISMHCQHIFYNFSAFRPRA